MSIDNLSVEQIKAARILLKWKQTDLSGRSGVSYPTVARLESGTGKLGGRADTIDKLVKALEAGGVTFIPGNGEGPGVRLSSNPKAPG